MLMRGMEWRYICIHALGQKDLPAQGAVIKDIGVPDQLCRR